jgi:PAS domain S-box-containing protein
VKGQGRGDRLRATTSPDNVPSEPPVVPLNPQQAAGSLLPAARLRQIIDSALDYAIISLDLNGRVTSWNLGAHRILGWTEGEMLGRTVHRFFTPQDVAAQRIEREMATALAEGFASDDNWRVRRDGSRFWASGQMTPLRDDAGAAIGFVKILRDRTRAHTADLRHAFLLELSEHLHEAEGVPQVTERIAAQLGALLGANRIGFGWVDDGESVHIERDWTDGPVPSVVGRHSLADAGTGVLEALRRGEVIVVDDLANDPRTAARAEKYAALQIRSLLLAPMVEGGRLTALVFVNSTALRRWNDEDVALVREVGERVCLAAERVRARDALRASEERLNVAQQAGGVGTFELFPDRGEVLVSEQFCRLWGLPVQAVVDLDALVALIHPDDRPRVATLGPEVSEDALAHLEYRITRPDTGEQRWMARRGQQVSDARSGRTRHLGVCYDITVHRQAIEALAASQESLRDESRTLETLNRTGTLLAADLAIDTLVQRVVDAGVELTGAQFGAFFYNVVADPAGTSYMLWALAGADRAAFEGFGMPRPTAMLSPTFQGQGVLRSADITQDTRYGRSPPHHGIPAGHLPVRSYLAVPVSGRSGEVIGGLFFGHAEADVFNQRDERVMAGLAAQAAIAIDNARLFQAAQKANETLEARVEQRTRERDQLWTLSEDLLVIAHRDGSLLRVSPSWTRLLGHSEAELLGQPYAALIHPDDRPRVEAVLEHMLATGQPVRFDDRVRASDGSWRDVAWTLAPEPGGGRMFGSGRDVTAERAQEARLTEAQEALRQAQKMEAVGQLTGGIAHDFNNLLQGITGSLAVIQRLIARGRTGELERFIIGAMNSAQRAAGLTHRLLAFSRRQPLDPKAVRANPLVMSMEDLLRRTLGEGVALELQLADGLWLTLCDPNQLENAILNLCINARDAMPDGGRLGIATRNASLDAAAAAALREVAPGEYVCISVTDSGVGMAPETAARAFEPFFTTKPIGHGTGLGLSMIYGFARQSEGCAHIDSTLGRGTTVSLYLPHHPDAAPADEMAAAPLAPAQAQAGAASETVLVVEDDPVVRSLIVDLLHEMGCQALEAPDGPSGLALLQTDPRIGLLISDIGLPGLDGRKMADAARAQCPELKVLLMTGYAQAAALPGGFLAPGMQLITKPFAMDLLAGRLREMLARA